MSILFCLFCTYIWNIQCRWFLYVHILHGLLSHVSNPICKKCCHFTDRHTLDDNIRPMDFELSLLHNVFPLCCFVHIYRITKTLSLYLMFQKCGMSQSSISGSYLLSIDILPEGDVIQMSGSVLLSITVICHTVLLM